MAAALAIKHADGQALVAVVLHVFDLAAAHADRHALPFGDFHLSVRGADLARLFERLLGEILKLRFAVGETSHDMAFLFWRPGSLSGMGRCPRRA